MAKKPVCRICGTAHWNHEPHAFAEEPSGPVEEEAEYKDETPVELKRPTAPDCKSGTPHAGSNPARGTTTATDRPDLSQAEVAKDGQPSTTVDTSGSGQASTERVKRWRERHREAYNEYQREYMRRRRASGS